MFKLGIAHSTLVFSLYYMIVREGDSKGFGEFEDLGVEFCQMVEELDGDLVEVQMEFTYNYLVLCGCIWSNLIVS